jgi:hypothetical protein
MKIKLVIVVWAFSLVCLYGQARTNAPKLAWDEVSGVLDKATGWAYSDSDREWLDYDNVISRDKSYKAGYSSLQGSDYMLSRGLQNFIDIQTKSVTYNGVKLYVVIFHQWHGEYKYPAIYRDWEYEKRHTGYVFSAVEYSKIRDIKGKIDLAVLGKVGGSKYNSSDEALLNELANMVDSDSHFGRAAIFRIMLSEEGMIRFYLPFTGYSDGGRYNFEKEYFETEPDNFKKIILE